MDNFLEYELKTHLGAILDSKIPKKGPNRTKIGREAQHPRGPINTLRVPIGTWEVSMPIGTKSRLSLGTF